MVSALPLLVDTLEITFFSFFSARTPISFLSAYMELGILRPGDIQLKKSSTSPISPHKRMLGSSSSGRGSPSPMSSPVYERNTNRELIKEELQATIKQLSNKCMLDVAFKPIQASAIATAILYYARKTCNIYPVWHEDLSHLTFHDPASSKSTMRALDLLEEMHSESQEEEEQSDSFASEHHTKEELLDDHVYESMSRLGLVSPTKENVAPAIAIATPEITKEKADHDVSPVSIATLMMDA